DDTAGPRPAHRRHAPHGPGDVRIRSDRPDQRAAGRRRLHLLLRHLLRRAVARTRHVQRARARAQDISAQAGDGPGVRRLAAVRPARGRHARPPAIPAAPIEARNMTEQRLRIRSVPLMPAIVTGAWSGFVPSLFIGGAAGAIASFAAGAALEWMRELSFTTGI